MRCVRLLAVVLCATLGSMPIRADSPNPVLNAVFPPGGKAGASVTVSVEGLNLEGLRDLYVAMPKLVVTKLDAKRFRLDIPPETPPGVYDLRTIGLHGMSSPRAFVVSQRTEVLEAEPNDSADAPQAVDLDVVASGRIEKPGDVDGYAFSAKKGQRVVLECWAERIDSKLRAVLDVHDSSGKRLAVQRQAQGVDPLVDFLAPVDGVYVAKLFDLSFLGSPSHFYRLDIDTKPRVEFAFPCVVTRGQTTRVKLFGRNLGQEFVEVDVTPRPGSLPMPMRSCQMVGDFFAYHLPGSNLPILFGVTDVPVVVKDAAAVQELAIGSEVCGQLAAGDEIHEFSVTARKGEVLWLEAFGERIGSPVDLEVAVLDATRNEIMKLADDVDNLGGYRFPTNHSDPSGRFVAPADGRYTILVRNVIGGLRRDPRRLYRLSVRREEPDFDLAVISRRTDQPAGFNVPVGGRELLEVVAIRRRGMSGPIKVTAETLPAGMHCPDVWIGPGQDRAVLVLSASDSCPPFAGSLHLVGHADGRVRPVRGGAMVWPQQTTPSGRLTQEIPLATGPPANASLTATPAHSVVYQESILEVAIDIETAGPLGAMQLSALGQPRLVGKPLVVLASVKKGWICFAFPATLPPGPYTFALQAEIAPLNKTLVSNPITVEIRPARIALEIDPRTPTKIARGKIIQLRFSAERRHGFLGKIHTELTAPGGVAGLLSRGVTFVGQTETGALQVIATEDAPLGRQPFLRLEAVGTVEDQPLFRASRFVELEITE